MGSVSEDLVPSEHFGPASRKCRNGQCPIVTGITGITGITGGARVRDVPRGSYPAREARLVSMSSRVLCDCVDNG